MMQYGSVRYNGSWKYSYTHNSEADAVELQNALDETENARVLGMHECDRQLVDSAIRR